MILPKTEVLPLDGMKKIVKFVKDGGWVVCVGGEPKYASKETEQESLEELWDQISQSVNYIDLQVQGEDRLSLDKAKTDVKNLLQQRVQPIWLARGMRIAKTFGYKKPIKVNQITGIEDQLERVLKLS